MNLTDAERLILANQHDILAKLDPANETSHQAAAQMLREGYHADWQGGLHDAISQERLDFAIDAHEACVMLNVPFTGFTDKRLNNYARFEDCEFEAGAPKSDSEYQLLIEKYAAREKAAA
jgi:uncharacterized protein YfbU (UPF0304 family)